jgi:hypothetical protein
MELNDLSQLIDLLRAKGVVTYSDREVTLTLGKLQAAAEEHQGTPAICPCGHDIRSEHNTLGCLHGCDVSACEPHLHKHDEE